MSEFGFECGCEYVCVCVCVCECECEWGSEGKAMVVYVSPPPHVSLTLHLHHLEVNGKFFLEGTFALHCTKHVHSSTSAYPHT